MADAATISVTATMLPDEIAKTISGGMTVTPADANHKWYYKLTSVSNSSTDLMAGYFTDYLAIDDDTAPIAITTSDTVAFLFIQNTDASNLFMSILQRELLQPQPGIFMFKLVKLGMHGLQVRWLVVLMQFQVQVLSIVLWLH